LELTADESELRMGAEAALKPIDDAIQRRLWQSRVLDWAVGQLPFAKTELDSARVRRECCEILADLPEDISEAVAKEALEPTIQEACHDVEEREAKRQRQIRKGELLQRGTAEVSKYLFELRLAGKVAADEYWTMILLSMCKPLSTADYRLSSPAGKATGRFANSFGRSLMTRSGNAPSLAAGSTLTRNLFSPSSCGERTLLKSPLIPASWIGLLQFASITMRVGLRSQLPMQRT
jgi:hypothetical protein